MIYNVSSIVDKDLCCSCGACSVVCGKGAINIVYRRGMFIPIVDENICVNCNQCIAVCPSAHVDVKSFYGELDLFSNEEKDCYVAFSKNEQLRHKGTSGGVVSTLVYELLKKEIYKKAYVLDYECFDGTPARLRPIVNPEDVINSAKSKYIPASVVEVISDIFKGTIEQSIIVATPCQLLAIKKSMVLKQVSDANVLFIGLFCDKTLNYNIYAYYKEKYGEYDSLHFRDKEGNNWPGDTVLSQQGKKTIIDKRVRMSLKPYFQLNRCRYCFDKLNQLADISCGDCYIDGEQSKEGKSSIVIRTEKGSKALQACMSALDFKKSYLRDIKHSQHIEIKRDNYKRNISERSPFVLSDIEGLWGLKDDMEIVAKMHMGANAMSVKDFNMIDDCIAKEDFKPSDGKLKKYCKRLTKVFFNPDRTINVLIDNVGFVNKGAELMLQSVVQKLEEVVPSVRIVVPKDVFYENLNYCYQHHILPLHLVYGGKKKAVKHFIYNNLLNKPWFITPDKIDVVLDASGFQFGDQWEPSESYVDSKKRYYSSFTKKNRKIIFLPQAFGPFEKPLSRLLMQNVYQVADLIYAREQVSYQYLKQLFLDDEKIKTAPDFTCLSHNKSLNTIQLPEDYIVLVPNVRMVTHTQQDISTNYLDFIYELSTFLIDRGESLVLLNHEGNDDLQLLLELNDRLSKKVIMLSNLDALEVKRIIGGAKLLISSRFHGVVSGLTQGVPTLCTSWSHKYFELLKEHECDGNILLVEDVEKAKNTIAEALESPSLYVSKKGCTKEVKQKAVQMWNEVLTKTGLLKDI